MTLLNDLANKIQETGLNIDSIAVMDRDGIHELQIYPANQCANCYSVAKSYTAAAIGMLWDRKLLRVEDRVFHILGEEFPERFDPRWKEVTVEHLLTHTVGFDRGLLDIDVEDLSAYPTGDFLKLVFSKTLPYLPGTHYQYTDAAFYLLSRIVSRLSEKRLDDFLRPVLFGKLGFRELAWSTCPHGYSMGATGLYLRTGDMVKLGYVYANGGLYQGKRILSEEWIDLSLERGYAFGKYRNTGIYAKGGMFGQKLCFSPEKGEAYAWHAYEPKKDTGVLIDILK